MKLYYPDGKEEFINLNEFVHFYNQCYYLDNSRFAEERIEELLDPGHLLSEQDVMLILRWKLNSIDHKNCEDGRIAYKKANLIDPENKYDPLEYETRDERGRKVDAKKLCEFIGKEYNNKNTNYQAVYKTLVELPEDSTKYLGPVYLLTLVSFISRGNYPIYDKYAMQAIKAIKNETKLGENAPVDKLIEQVDKTNTTEVFRLYDNYIKDLKDVFENQFNTRTVDRALWKYGHLFK